MAPLLLGRPLAGRRRERGKAAVLLAPAIRLRLARGLPAGLLLPLALLLRLLLLLLLGVPALLREAALSTLAQACRCSRSLRQIATCTSTASEQPTLPEYISASLVAGSRGSSQSGGSRAGSAPRLMRCWVGDTSRSGGVVCGAVGCVARTLPRSAKGSLSAASLNDWDGLPPAQTMHECEDSS